MNTLIKAKKSEEIEEQTRTTDDKKQKNFIFYACIIGILVITIITRFYKFDNRWWIGNDDTRDVAIAHIALQRHELPMNGSFSSAGPFMFGAIFYWTIMLSVLLIPTFVGPWLFIAIINIITVGILTYIGYLLGGKKLSILIGFFAALSPHMISRSFSLSQHSYIPLTTTLLILFFIQLWQKKQLKYGFFMGIALGTGIAMHYQAINLLLFFPIILLAPLKKIKDRIYALLIMVMGFLIPSLPMIIWDAQQQFANTRNILDYLLIGQKRIYVPNSWRIFIFDFLPNYWSFIIGSWRELGLILQMLTPIILLILLIRKKITQPILTLSATFSIMLLINRYYQGERSEGYLLYLQPFILILTAYGINYMTTTTKIIKMIAVTLILSITTGNTIHAIKLINIQAPTQSYIQTVQYLIKKYPNQKFSIYDYEWKNSHISQPISLLLFKEKRIDANGTPIGITTKNQTQNVTIDNQITYIGDAYLLNLSQHPNLKQDKQWINVNPESMYDDLIKWSKTEKLQSNFRLFKKDRNEKKY